jgi:ABC-type transporter Mla maintaining outer membrane lipid asymmetry ATPase subunit MlaF
VTASVLEFAEVAKNYGGLRPLRISQLRVEAGQRAGIVGFDRPAAEVFVNLATGAVLPDAGTVMMFGRPTSAITDSTDWLATIDRVGIVSERAVLLEQLTVVQNLAMPFTLDIEPPPSAERARAEALAREVGLAESVWAMPLVGLDALAAMRVRLGRAIALDPAVLLLEHASAPLTRETSAAFAASVRGVADARRLAVVALTSDDSFARAIGAAVLVHEPATGRLKESGRGWFGWPR